MDRTVPPLVGAAVSSMALDASASRNTVAVLAAARWTAWTSTGRTTVISALETSGGEDTTLNAMMLAPMAASAVVHGRIDVFMFAARRPALGMAGFGRAITHSVAHALPRDLSRPQEHVELAVLDQSA
jgi:hypothetical protein